MILALLGVAPVLATAGFDPTTPQAVFSDAETFTQDGSIRLWAEIARYDDPDRALFGPVHYNASTAWPASSAYAPWIATCFGTSEPASSAFLLHVGPSLALATGTPILFVPGAGDNASRGFVTMAAHMDIAGRPTFAMTFGHPHGDVYQQAELVADAVAVVRARTGTDVIDVVSHSKGGIAVATYLSSASGVAWDGAAYEAVGTRYRGDVRRAVFIATPLGGIDTTYRWPAGNLLALDADLAYSPSSWNTYYPYTSANYWTSVDLADQDFLPDGLDLFPGQRQLLKRQDYPLPYTNAALGIYAAQPDGYSSYEGGLGSISASDGIDEAIHAGGDLLDHLRGAGVDPSVELFLLAGENPLMPNGADTSMIAYFGDVFGALADANIAALSVWLGELVGDGLLSVGITGVEVQGIVSGDLVLGEISGPSDGVVFVSSATDGSALTGRGAEVVESKVVNLSHLDLLYASPITGQLLIDDAAVAEANAWEAAVGERYIDADTLGWVERVLADAGNPDDSGGDSAGDTADDTGAPDVYGDTDGATDGASAPLPCGSCTTGAGSVAWFGVLLAAWAARRAPRSVGRLTR